MRLLRRHWFLLGLLFAVGAGMLLPGAGRILDPRGRWIRVLTILIFWVAGLTLPTETIRHGLANVRLHALNQGFCFLVIPAYFFATGRWFAGYLDGTLLVGLYALAVLPTTIATCVVFTQTSGGNTFAALFNSSLANLAAVVVSPMLLSLFLRGSGATPAPGELGRIVLGLALTMLGPVLLGQVMRRRFPKLTGGRRHWSEASSGLILIVIFLTFSRAAENPDLVGRLSSLGLPFLYLASSHVLFLALSYGAAAALGLPRADRICAIYTAPQKSMAMGVPMLTVYFAGSPELLGVAVVPLLLYHPWQLLMAGILRSVFFHAESGRG